MGCILSGKGQFYCDAVHLLAHHKGDSVCYSYSQSILAHHRNGGSTFRLILNIAVETDIVEDIDNVRNGLLLHNSIHWALGEHVAFLTVCDACMMSIQSLMVLVSRRLTLP